MKALPDQIIIASRAICKKNRRGTQAPGGFHLTVKTG